MHCACVNGHLDTVKVLLSVFADTNITNDEGDTPIATCEYWGSPELAHYIQHNHPMYVSDDGDDHNGTVTNKTDNSPHTTHKRLTIKCVPRMLRTIVTLCRRLSSHLRLNYFIQLLLSLAANFR
jgi:ankyrin repeat protein